MNNELRDLIQLFGSVGVAVIGVLLTSKRDKSNNEHQLINQLQEIVYSKNETIETLTVKKEALEEKINTLTDNYDLKIESLREEKDNIKNILNKQIDELNKNHSVEIDNLRYMIQALTLENIYLKNNLSSKEIEEAENFAKNITDIADLGMLLKNKNSTEKQVLEDSIIEIEKINNKKNT